MIAVRFREPSDATARRAVIDPKEEVGSFDDRYEVPNEKLTVVAVARPDQPGHARVAAAATALNGDPNVDLVAPVFDLGSKQVIATDRILVGFKPETSDKADEIIKDYGGEVIETKDDEYVVRLKPNSNPFDVIADLTKRAEVDYAEPDFVTIGQHRPRRKPASANPVEPMVGEGRPIKDVGSSSASSAPDKSKTGFGLAATATAAAATAATASTSAGADPLQRFQYALRLTRAVEAWDKVTPSPDIKVAILDEGVDITHPDLASAVEGTFDAIDGDADQRPNPWDGHGTACAGLAVAVPNNAMGIRGIAGGCSLLAARIAFSPSQNADWVTTNSKIRDAIDWAWRNGADILSNSWGGGAPSNAIINAFERARNQGRNGKGSVIVVAAGNESEPVRFPGNLPNVLTISASNEFDEPKTRTSADGEGWWGSSFGPEVDIAAPGVHNYTTDISGEGGYNPGGALDSNYVSDFNGTSSSTPIVAGVAALVLSANPNLREAQVRRILKQTADKVGQVVYTNGRNDQMGNGRVNAVKAVETAASLV
jgi:subtilisin family serine protease